MTPAHPVFPGQSDDETIWYGQHQSEYFQLPAHKVPDDPSGRIVTRWSMTWWERIQVLLLGNVYVSVLTFNTPLQPLRVDAVYPREVLNG